MSDDDMLGTMLRRGLERAPAPEHDLAGVRSRAVRLRIRRRAGIGVVAVVAAAGLALPLLLLFPLGQEKPHPPGLASGGTTVSGQGLSIELPEGWDGRIVDNTSAAFPVLQVANFTLGPIPPGHALADNERTSEGPDQVVMVLQDLTSLCPCGGLPKFEPATPPFALSASEVGVGMEGIPPGHDFARKTFTFGGRWFDLWVEFGSNPAPNGVLDQVNSVLQTLVIAPEQLPSAQDGWVTHLDLQDGVTVDTPADWSFNDNPVPDLIGPRVLFAVGTWPVPTGGECLPSIAARDLPADGALLFVLEYGGTGADGGMKASDFPPRNGDLQLGALQGPLECLGEKAQEVVWQQGGRYFQAYAMFGPNASDQVRTELQQSLNSVQPFDTSCETQRPAPGEYESHFSATSGRPGDSITVTGTLPWPPLNEGGQYVPSDHLAVWWNDRWPDSGLSSPQGAPEQLATWPEEGACRYSITFRIPDTPPGTYPVTVRDYGGGGYGWSGGTDVRVEG